MENKAPSMLGPALIAGGSLGFASGLPFVSCLCCVLAAGAGFLAALLYSRKCREAEVRFTAGGGAGVGLLAGVVFGIVGGAVFSLVSLVTGQLDAAALADAAAQNPMADPEAIEQITRFMESTGPAVIVLILLFLWLLMGTILGAAGGVIGGAAFKVEPPAGSQPTGWPVGEPPPPPVGPGS